MRVFYALTFKKTSRERLALLRDDIANSVLKGRFVRESNFHLTLQFIGDVTFMQADLLADIMYLQKLILPTNLLISHAGSFVKRNKETVWAGIEKNEMLMNFQKKLRISLPAADFKLETLKYIPHITLGREVLTEKPISDYIISPFRIDLESFVLMESKRVNDYLTYEPIEVIDL